MNEQERTIWTPLTTNLRYLILILALVVFIVPLSAFGQNDARATFSQKHQIGVRLGGWSNNGDDPPLQFADTSAGGISTITPDFTDVAFYIEGFFMYRLNSMAALEFSLGFVNRGDVTGSLATGGTDIGTLNIYPILGQLKLYIPGGLSNRLYPYLSVGGGLYYGRNSIQITDQFFNARERESSASDFNYVLGGGADYALADQLGLDINLKYMPINFGKDLMGIRDYRALTISVGVKYLYTSKKKK
ncbi:MAG: outer membrane beta-barrel protein [candidate division Zixibacteria bacterium]